ncbi:TRAM domain-containing protein [Halobaculum sp. WSA2]|uniref:TRAM domain-containing protein n=1 Tax=Halobaculum saliterrae TaxID=2073113 RepID=A0A6B0SQB5_9EURY|nr:TRAM domain-containing protein [Halobaculum saliterrae]MXR40667.1 TRAM domain-containing protein [Halobaculum saliterrae]
MEISEDLRCVFSGEVERRNGTYVVEVPEREVELDTIRPDRVYRVAILGGHKGDGGKEGVAEAIDSSSPAAERSEGMDSAATGRSDHTGPESNPGEDTEQGARSSGSTSDTERTAEPEPPVDRGDEVTVDIEGIGDQGDGIARVDRGYVIIVPDTEKGERVQIRVTSVKQNVAFAEVVERVERHHYE